MKLLFDHNLSPRLVPALQRSLVLGAPPKFVWIRRGNCSTDDILALLSTRHTALLAFELDRDAAFLVLG
ncbi:MAG: hypothetical protein A3C53_02460 [Omnitrophica WOR_2 bacterium RIFCSPHIGHO2_02_FULL_68_15]|nr:MAG: hypothetical protein A3C53_02460 [Omnitrophica WOR_2 bacterium RIFCSPHIGHO2_02_FULL_68_15]